MGRIPRRIGLAGLCLLLLVAGLTVGGAGGAALGVSRYTVSRTNVAPGLTLTRMVDKTIPRRVFVLTVDISQPLTMDVALAQDHFPGYETTSSMAARHSAIAAVNGDFGGFEGFPTHPFAEDGDLKRTSTVPGVGFAVSADEQTITMAQPNQSVTAVETASGETLSVDHWNDGPPALGEIAGYTSVGGTLDPPPANACSVRLFPTGTPQLQVPAPGVATDYTVEQAACAPARMATEGGVVLSAKPGTDEAQQLLALTPGTPIRITWSFGWPDVLDSIGGVPWLVRNGQVVATNCTSSFCHRNPRTGVGVTADGKILLVVVDGRQPKYSLGFSLLGFAQFFQQIGAVFALNLDGGGSTTMYVNGKVVNKPSDGFERRVSSALLVLPGPDTAEPLAVSAGLGSLAGSAPSPASDWMGPWRRAELDPGSTGGMLDALARGELGFPGYRLPEAFLGVVRRFRAGA